MLRKIAGRAAMTEHEGGVAAVVARPGMRRERENEEGAAEGDDCGKQSVHATSFPRRRPWDQWSRILGTRCDVDA